MEGWIPKSGCRTESGQEMLTGGHQGRRGDLVLRNKSGRVDSWAFKVPRPQRAEDSSGDNALFFGKYRPPEALQSVDTVTS